MINNEQEEFGLLDAITIVSFMAQLDNMNKDVRQTEWIHKVILALAKDVQKLHEENEILIKKVDKVLNILEEKGKWN